MNPNDLKNPEVTGPMTLNEYQAHAATTAMYPGAGGIVGLAYTTLGLTGEAGEVANKTKKILRGDGGSLEDRKKAIVKELGDVLWYLAMTAQECDVTLEDVAVINVDTLRSRHERGVIQGDGDNR